MKIRTDFVTNSSSSSFVTFVIDSPELEEYIDTLRRMKVFRHQKHGRIRGSEACDELSIDRDGIRCTVQTTEMHVVEDLYVDQIDIDSRSIAQHVKDNKTINNSKYILEAISGFLNLDADTDIYDHMKCLIDKAYAEGKTFCDTFIDETDGFCGSEIDTSPYPHLWIDQHKLGGYESGNTTSEPILEETIKHIGADVFRECKFEKIQLPEGIITIGNNVFRDCGNLVEIILPKSLQSIGKSAFEGCSSLKTIIIPEKVKALENNTFRGCTSLECVKLEGVQIIGDRVFEKCKNLSEIITEKNLEKIGKDAFKQCKSLAKVPRITKSIPTTD